MTQTPTSRRVRILAFDPSLTTRLETASVNVLTLSLPWEELERGPVGEYIEVVDYDPASGVFYEPVDLSAPHVLAQDGVPPSESNPQFHQQMVYAVAMTTIRQFERALGRVAFWSDHTVVPSPTASERGDVPSEDDPREANARTRGYADQFVRRLRIYPHGLREQNAYYSPAKKALLFGYFPVARRDRYNTPGTVVFTCLSHDIIAHEVTHALLDGVHPRFNEPTNPDVHAFHEAFADIVALFQHFSYPDVLEHQIRRTRGDLHTENLLSQLAQQFGRATGRGAALRDALGGEDPKTGAWAPRDPDPHALEDTFGPHDRGAILVAAVFRAFLLIYRARTADLFRIASQGTGELPSGDIHPDLAHRLAADAAKCADRVLQMCIRAIDYCPPVDITFGDFLRAIITADADYTPEDPAGYRTVFIQSFREWGVRPRGVRSMGIDALAWPSGEERLRELIADGALSEDELHYAKNAAADERLLRTEVEAVIGAWDLESDRYQVWRGVQQLRWRIWRWLTEDDRQARYYAALLGLVIDPDDAPPTVYRADDGRPSIEVHSARPAIRRLLSGGSRRDLVVEVTQRRRGYWDPAEQASKDAGSRPVPHHEHGDFIFRAGCTALIDLSTQTIRRIIRTPGTVADDRQLERVRRYRYEGHHRVGNAFDGGLAPSLRAASGPTRDEPFSLLHSLQDAT